MQKLRLFGMNGVLALILVVMAAASPVQSPYYLILIDSENNQPFTARIGDNLMSSSPNGHLLIGQLQDSVYHLAIRFPHKAAGDQVFAITIRKRDQGFQLKSSGNSWVLFNWQTRETIQPLKEVDSSRLLDYGQKQDDGFSKLMAAVVNDSSVQYSSFSWDHFAKDSLNKTENVTASVSGEPVKPGTAGTSVLATSHATATKGSVQAKANPKNSPASVDSLKSVAVVHSGSTVKKIREVSLKISRKMVFTDASSGIPVDTITLFVYFEKPVSASKKPVEDPMVTARKLLKKKDTLNNKLVGNPQSGPTADSVRQNICKQEAADQDVESLRSEILKRNTPDEKIAAATDTFSVKCFSVAQVRKLTELFVSDKSKYRLLEAAYGHVSDSGSFPELIDVLSDKADQKKFQTLLQKHR